MSYICKLLTLTTTSCYVIVVYLCWSMSSPSIMLLILWPPSEVYFYASFGSSTSCGRLSIIAAPSYCYFCCYSSGGSDDVAGKNSWLISAPAGLASGLLSHYSYLIKFEASIVLGCGVASPASLTPGKALLPPAKLPCVDGITISRCTAVISS